MLEQPEHGVLSGSMICESGKAGETLLIRLIDAPASEGFDQCQKLADRARRRASWLHHPGWCCPRDFFFDQGQWYWTGPGPASTTVEEYLGQVSELAVLKGWLAQLCEMLMEIHNHRQPFFLGQLSPYHLRVHPNGSLQVLGLELNGAFRWVFRGDPQWVCPDSKVDERTDIWSLGELFARLLEMANPKVREAYTQERGLRDLITGMRSPQPERRPQNLAAVKSRLEQLKYRPSEVRRSLLQLPSAWELAQEYYHQLLVGAVATFVTGIVVMQFLFPA